MYPGYCTSVKEIEPEIALMVRQCILALAYTREWMNVKYRKESFLILINLVKCPINSKFRLQCVPI